MKLSLMHKIEWTTVQMQDELILELPNQCSKWKD